MPAFCATSTRSFAPPGTAARAAGVAEQSAGAELLEAVRLALAGAYHVTPLVTSRLSAAQQANRTANPAEMFGVHPAATRCTQLIAEGKTFREMSSALDISLKTTEFHRKAVMNELGLRTTAELARYAMLHGV